MSITVYPYKLNQRELEARLEPGLTVLPGQYLRFATAEPIFGQVREVRALPPSSPGLLGGYRLMIDLLYGTPSLHPQQVVLMNAAQMGHEIQRLQEPIAQPLQLSPDFSAELVRLGALTIIGGDDFVQKYEALQLLIRAIQPYRRLVILDPLGVFAPEDGYALWQAGRDVRLSLQAVGSKSFLDTFGELFAPGLREAALRVVADHLPPMHEFMGFQGLLDWYSALNVPLKNLILQNFQAVTRSHVFADSPEQTLDWGRTVNQPVTVLNLSCLQEPWRGLFFREAVQALLEQSGEDVLPVLLYPENYLPNLAQWIHKADEAEFKLLMLASPYVDEALLSMANNRFWVEMPGKVSLMGGLTLGLPLTLPVPSTLTGFEHEAAHATADGAMVHHPPHSDEQLTEQLFSSFNVPLAEDGAVIDEVKSSVSLPHSDAEVPVHWLGEAAGPVSLEPSLHTAYPDEAAKSLSLKSMETFAEPSTTPSLAQTVVDLSAPPPEAAPEFLTASQLSQLLGSGSTGLPLAGALPGPNAALTHPVGDLSMSASQELPLSPEVIPAPPAVDPPVPVPPVEALRSLQPEPLDSVYDVEPDFDFPLESPSAIAGQPVMPPFPTPEEYEKEEFHFDLNPDDQAFESPRNAAPTTYSQTDAVSQSLDDFSSLDIPVEPLFDFDPTGQVVAPQSPTPVYDPGAVAAQEGATILSGIGQTDQEMNDALDLIFPNYAEVAQANEAMMHAEYTPKPGPALLDEPMAVVQKTVEPSVTDSVAFHAGDRVAHPTYGVGVVQKVIPTEESVVLNITFDTVGKRLLDPALCELTRA